MPNERLTEIICVLDRSGSMASIREDAEGALNAFMESQRKFNKEHDQKANVTLVQFDTEIETVWENTPIEQAAMYKLQPRGWTRLLDAIGQTINNVGKRLSGLPEKERPGKILFVIITDGLENSSKEFKKIQINEMITHQREKYSWQFNFLAANQDAIQEAEMLGMSGKTAMNFSHTGRGIKHAIAVYCTGATNYRSSGDVEAMSMPDCAPEDESDQSTPTDLTSQ